MPEKESYQQCQKIVSEPNFHVNGKRNSTVGNVSMCFASRSAFSALSDPLFESANLRKNPNRAGRQEAQRQAAEG